MKDSQLRSANALLLKWHSGAAPSSSEAFRSWVIASLKAELPFNGAAWGVLPGDALTSNTLVGAYAHGIDEAALADLVSLRAEHLQPASAPTAAVNMSLVDARWHGPDRDALRVHAQRYGLTHTLLMCCGELQPGSPGRQFVLLTRRSPTDRFMADEVARFEFLAPHMMLAYATRRRALIDQPVTGPARAGSNAAVALVDRDGFVHDRHTRFMAMLRREWPDWDGHRLPDTLLDKTARRFGTAWRFDGAAVVADFVPAENFYVLTARPRHRTDGLTERETEIARRYAEGGSFREVAASLNVAPATVRSHLRNVFGKLQIRNKAQLAAVLR